MKSAQQWAEEAMGYIFAHERESGRDVLRAVAAMFEEHARDQRQCCAAEVYGLDLGSEPSDDVWTVRDESRKRALNAPAPGEKQ